MDAERVSKGAGRQAGGCAWRLAALLALGLGALMNGGCRSTPKPESEVFASVIIAGNTPGQIGAMTTQVFQAHGYKVAAAGRKGLVFEKEGSTWSNLAYGSWLGDTPVWERVKVAIEPVAEAAFRLQCQAYRVQDRGGALEEETKIGQAHARPYEKLLEEVAARFRPSTP
jgi:hypothetical protein